MKRLADEPASKVVIPALTPRSQSGLRGHSLTPEEEQILSLAGKLARLTPRILMAHSPVSKATATRRLAALAERALLTRWGKGRGTYYTLTAATEAGARSIERLQPQFVALQPMLWSEFNVTAIGMQHEAEAPESPTALPLRLLVEFERVPQLTTFFALESELTKRLRLEVDLRPIETFSLTDQVAIRAEALWFWRTQPEIDPVTTDLQP